MNTSLFPTEQSSQSFKGWLGCGLLSFLTLHLLRSSGAISHVTVQTIFYAVQASAVSYFSLSLFQRRSGWLSTLVELPKGCKVAITLGVAMLAVSHALPAQAAFYSAAEGFIASSFPQTSAVVPLLFNALRLVFLMYTAVALLSVMNAFKQGEEWTTVARTPAAVIVVVALGDVLTSVIVA